MAVVAINLKPRAANIRLADGESMSINIDIPKLGSTVPELGIFMMTIAPPPMSGTPLHDSAKGQSALADALFTATQQKVLGLLFGQPNRSFFVTQVMDLVNSGRGAAQRELQRLERAGLVSMRMHGNQKHYQANPDSPLFDEVCSIIRKTVGLEVHLRAAVDSMSGTVDLALLYGSVAKRTDTSASDIDLLIVAQELTLEDVYASLSTAEESLGRTINPTLYTRAEFDRRRANKNSFLERVLAGPVILLSGSIDDE